MSIFLKRKETRMIFPQEVIIEITNICNLKCLYCHFHGKGALRKRKLGLMEKTLWIKILEDIGSWSDKTKGVNICLHGAGEPLLHPQFEEILKKAKGIPKARIGFMTNGMLFTEKWHKLIIDLQVDWIWFSIDGTKAEINDFYRKGASLKTIESNIQNFVNLKERTKSIHPAINFNMVRYPEITEDEMKEYVKKWLPIANIVSIATFRPIGSKKLLSPENKKNIPYKPCPLIYSQLVIGWDGEVGLCCEDINVEIKLGNVKAENLISIFNGDRMQKIRKLHEKGQRKKISLCKDCDVWAYNLIIYEKETLINGIKVKKVKTPAAITYYPIAK